MPFSTRPPYKQPFSWETLRYRLSHLFSGNRQGRAYGPLGYNGEMDPRLQYLGRRVRAASPETRLSEAMEMLRMSPYRLLPVVAKPDDAEHGQNLLGILTETRLVNALLAAETPEARAALRSQPVRDLMETPAVTLSPSLRASEAALRFDDSGADTLPITEASGELLGLVSRSDLVQEMMRPFRPPLIGGMATPVGVYLTTGGVSGGVGTGALVLMGLAMSMVYLVTFLLGQPLSGIIHHLPATARPAAELFFQSVIQMGLFLMLIRLSPMAGYHAAEHQVVHAVERGEPLLVQTVREMPRVHPRCGTNLVAGGMMLWLIGTALQPVIGELSYMVSGILALAYWRTFGSWLQQHLTTRPASDREIESGIYAAKIVLEKYGRDPYAPITPLNRLWRMGFLQILMGFVAGGVLVYLTALLIPPLHAPLKSYLDGLW